MSLSWAGRAWQVVEDCHRSSPFEDDIVRNWRSPAWVNMRTSTAPGGREKGSGSLGTTRSRLPSFVGGSTGHDRDVRAVAAHIG